MNKISFKFFENPRISVFGYRVSTQITWNFGGKAPPYQEKLSEKAQTTERRASIHCTRTFVSTRSSPYASRLGFPGGSVVKESTWNAGDAGDSGSIPGSGRSPGGGNGNPLRYSCLKSPMDRGAWRATGHGVAKSRTWPSDWADLSCFPTSGWIWITQVLGWGTPTLRILILQIWGETWGSAFLTHDANAAGLRTKPWEPEC